MKLANLQCGHWPVIALLLALSLPCQAASAGADRIFSDGFDPCCRIGGAASGLTGSGLILQFDAGAVSENRPISANGIYDFAGSVSPGVAYSVNIDSQPTGQTCSLANASGIMGTANIDNVNVACKGNLEWDAGSWSADWN